MKDYKEEIKRYIEDEKQVLDCMDTGAINAAMNLIEETYEKEGTIYIFGNGGSSATASHYQNDFNKGISEHTEKNLNSIA